MIILSSSILFILILFHTGNQNGENFVKLLVGEYQSRIATNKSYSIKKLELGNRRSIDDYKDILKPLSEAIERKILVIGKPYYKIMVNHLIIKSLKPVHIY